MSNIAILASGSGTNAENIIAYFNKNEQINVQLVASNCSDAYVLHRAKKWNIPSIIFNKNDFYYGKTILDTFKLYNIDTIVLAGFLWLIPEYLIEAYAGHIINIHPALLPNYGGKGMYGMNVHKAVVANGEAETGITIHLVNNEYDKGAIIFQAKCKVEKDDSPETVAQKVHELEYKYFPRVIDCWLKGIDMPK